MKKTPDKQYEESQKLGDAMMDVGLKVMGQGSQSFVIMLAALASIVAFSCIEAAEETNKDPLELFDDWAEMMRGFINRKKAATKRSLQ